MIGRSPASEASFFPAVIGSGIEEQSNTRFEGRTEIRRHTDKESELEKEFEGNGVRFDREFCQSASPNADPVSKITDRYADLLSMMHFIT
ncbi:MAG: hypothetical protein ABSB78_04690 [Bacteroidota bacterium]